MKILILTAKFGMGHFSAAEALSQQIEAAYPRHQVIVSDLCELVFPRHHEKVYKTYSKMIVKGSKLINYVYKSAVYDEHKLPKSLYFPQHILLKRLSSYLDEAAPDMIITTYSLAARLVSDYLKRRGSNCPLISSITDVDIHDFWYNSNTALYLVACQEAKEVMIANGVPAQSIAVSGIPVGHDFRINEKEKKNNQTREMLIMGGGLGMLPDDKAFYQELSKIVGLHTTIICGRNNSLRQKLNLYGFKKIEVRGYCSDVSAHMAKADLLLTKPGGITTFEAIHMELPLLVFEPALEQEIINCEFILRHDFGEVLSESSGNYAKQITAFINNEQKLLAIAENMAKLRASLDNTSLVQFINEEEARIWEKKKKVSSFFGRIA